MRGLLALVCSLIMVAAFWVAASRGGVLEFNFGGDQGCDSGYGATADVENLCNDTGW